jgi:hypothetical protein
MATKKVRLKSIMGNPIWVSVRSTVSGCEVHGLPGRGDFPACLSSYGHGETEIEAIRNYVREVYAAEKRDFNRAIGGDKNG